MSDYDGLHEAEKRRKDDAAIKRHKQLLQLGVKVEETHNGFLVNDKFVIGRYRNRWRVKGRGQWYWFKSIPDFVKKYVNEE